MASQVCGANTVLRFMTPSDLQPYTRQIKDRKIQLIYQAYEGSKVQRLYFEGLIPSPNGKVVLCSKSDAKLYRLDQSDRITIGTRKEEGLTDVLRCYFLGVAIEDIVLDGRDRAKLTSLKVWGHFFPGEEVESHAVAPPRELLEFEKFSLDFIRPPLSERPPVIWLNFQQLLRHAGKLLGQNLVLATDKDQGPWYIVQLFGACPRFSMINPEEREFYVETKVMYEVMRREGSETHAVGHASRPWIQEFSMRGGQLFVGIQEEEAVPTTLRRRASSNPEQRLGRDEAPLERQRTQSDASRITFTLV